MTLVVQGSIRVRVDESCRQGVLASAGRGHKRLAGNPVPERELTGHKASAVGNGQLQGRGGRPLIMAGGVVRVPHENARNTAVHSDGHEARHSESHLGRGHIRNHRVADDRDGQGEEHNDPAKPQPVGYKCYEDCGQVREISEREASYAADIPVTGVATAYGMTDHSCAWLGLDVILRLFTIVGSWPSSRQRGDSSVGRWGVTRMTPTKRPKEYKPERMEK